MNQRKPDFVLQGIGLRSFGNMVVEGEALVTDQPITLLGFVDHNTGKIVEKTHPLFGQSITEKIFVFPRGLGSTVGPYVLLNLKDQKTAPKAILNSESDQGTVSGCSVSRIPLAYRIDISKLQTGDKIQVSLENGKATIQVWRSK